MKSMSIITVWNDSSEGMMEERDEVDEFWLYMLLALIGEQLDDGDEIVGAEVSVKAKEYRLAVWTRQADRLDLIQSIGIRFKQALALDESRKIDYIADESFSKVPYRN